LKACQGIQEREVNTNETLLLSITNTQYDRIIGKLDTPFSKVNTHEALCYCQITLLCHCHYPFSIYFTLLFNNLELFFCFANLLI
jgi:hypothetical protein